MKVLFFCLIVFLFSSCATGPSKEDLYSASQSNAELGANYLGSGFLKKAKSKLEKALEQNSENSLALGTYAIFLSRIGKNEEANDYFNKALKITPENSKLLNNYGVYLCKMDKVNLAEKSFLKAIDNKLYETPEFALLNAGICLLNKEQYQAASQYFTQAVNVKRSYSDAYFFRAKSQFLGKEYKKAEQDILKYHEIVQENSASLWMGYKIASKTNNRLIKEEYSFKLRYRFPESKETKLLIERHL